MKRPAKRDEYSGPRNPQTATQGPDLEIVSDPRISPPRIALFDATNFDRWIQVDEDLLIDLVAMR